MSATADVVVVGGGVMGASIAFHAASRGADVVLLERGAVCSGPTRHSTAIVRLHYSQPLLVRMAAQGQRVYRAFEDVVGAPSGYRRAGLLVCVDPADRAQLRANVEVGRAEGVETHLVDAGQVAEIDPRVRTDDLVWCYEPGAGRCDPYLVTAGFARAAERLGATVRPGVEAVRVAEGGVETPDGAIDAGAVVVAAGVWSAALLAPLGYDLPVRAARAEVGRFRLPAEVSTAPPVIADFSPAQLYLCPTEPGFLDVGSLDPGQGDDTVDPDDPPEGARTATLRGYAERLAARLPAAAAGHFRGAFTGVYDVTPDWQPALGRVPGAERTFVAAGFSGHGFKLAPAVGAVVAELALDGAASSFDVGLLAPDRFERGELVGGRYGATVLG